MLNHILTALDDYALAFDQNEGKYTFISANVAELAGYDSDAFKNNLDLWQSIIDARDIKQVHGINEAPALKSHLNFTYRITTAQGKTKWVNEKRSVFVDEQTGHSILLSIVKDVQSEEDAKYREQFLSSLIDSQTNFLIRIDINGLYTFVNKQFLQTFGYAEQEILEKHYSLTTIPEEAELCEKAFYDCMNNVGKVVTLVHKKPGKDGILHDTEWELIAIANKNGEVTEIQGIGQDITERIQANQSILDKNERLQNIASISSHELRRPVATMLGLINIFDRQNFYNPENKEIIEHLLTVGNEIDDVIRQIVNNAFINQ
jgi:PAS domain S-box-containing protein